MYDGKLVEDRRVDRRSRFLVAGLALFGEIGYQNTSIAMVCKSAGLARAQFYELFDNREDLLLAVYDMIHTETRQAAAAAVTAAASRNSNIFERSRAAMTAFARAIGTDPHRARVMFVEVVGVSERVEQHRIEQREIWVQFLIAELRQNMGEDFVPPGGYRAAATGFIGALMALVHQWSLSEPRTELSDVTDVLTAFLAALTQR